MKTDMTLRTRREFLRTTVLGGALASTVPAFLANTFSALQASAADSAVQTTTGRDGDILVVLQMAGGNDGLNTVVPYSNDYYRRSRPRIGIAASDVHKLNDELGLHPSLAGFKDLYDNGQLSVVQGIGYPNPNRSHFRSTEIWQTASDSQKFEKYGWLGRYFDNACAGCDPTVGVSIGRQMPQAFAAQHPLGISLENPQQYRFISGDPKHHDGSEESFRKLNEADEAMMSSDSGGAEGNSGGTIGSIHGKTPHTGSVLDFVERTSMDAEMSSDKIIAVSNKVQNKAQYPQSPLANNLKLVARLIGGGLPTRVYYVSQGGYDTHVNQLPAQQRLLKDLGDSVKAFTEDMKAQGNLSRVLVMTFSEFGRRVAENANGGTDHGAAAPMFVIGDKVKAGLLGKYPSLAPGDLFNGDVKFTVDFRTVYAGLLEGWLKTPSAPILGRQFQPLMCV
ncbi:MAG TPA: DUF1501 domain-containing protein [Verrucomicrobiae bacterium]|nr:DUF1501 domain-containing protein [Verrucomicrobiae bacterium]